MSCVGRRTVRRFVEQRSHNTIQLVSRVGLKMKPIQRLQMRGMISTTLGLPLKRKLSSKWKNLRSLSKGDGMVVDCRLSIRSELKWTRAVERLASIG